MVFVCRWMLTSLIRVDWPGSSSYWNDGQAICPSTQTLALNESWIASIETRVLVSVCCWCSNWIKNKSQSRFQGKRLKCLRWRRNTSNSCPNRTVQLKTSSTAKNMWPADERRTHSNASDSICLQSVASIENVSRRVWREKVGQVGKWTWPAFEQTVNAFRHVSCLALSLFLSFCSVDSSNTYQSDRKHFVRSKTWFDVQRSFGRSVVLLNAWIHNVPVREKQPTIIVRNNIGDLVWTHNRFDSVNYRTNLNLMQHYCLKKCDASFLQQRFLSTFYVKLQVDSRFEICFITTSVKESQCWQVLMVTE